MKIIRIIIWGFISFLLGFIFMWIYDINHFAHIRISYRFEKAARQVRSVYMTFASYECIYGYLPSPDFSNRVLNNKTELPSRFNLWDAIDKKPPLDPWDKPFVYIDKPKNDCSFGIYSKGEDGISNTNGNDPDDLNTWTNTDRPYQYYLSKINRRDLIVFIIRGLFSGLFIFIIFLIFYRIFNRKGKNNNAASSNLYSSGATAGG